MADDVVVLIPDGGGYLSILAGETVIDFYEGTITDPNGSVTNLRTSLRSNGREVMNSVYLYAASSVNVSVGGGNGSWTVEADQAVDFTNFPFRELYLTAAATTAVRLATSTYPAMRIKVERGDRGADISQGLVSIGATLTLISAANASRKSVIIWNPGITIVYIGGPTTTTSGATQGIPLAPSGTIVISNTVAAVYGICAVAGSVNYLEG